MSDAELRGMIEKTQEAIYAHAGHFWFTRKTAQFLFEIGVITNEEYERAVGMVVTHVFRPVERGQEIETR